MWAKNSENVKELLRLNRSVQGVSLEFVAIDRTVHISTRVNNHLYFVQQDTVMRLWKLHFLFHLQLHTLTDPLRLPLPSPSPCPLDYL